MIQARFTTIETKRLCLRRFNASDLATLMAYRNDPLVAMYQSWEAMSTREAHALIVEMQTTEPGVPGPGFQFAVTLKATGVHIGDCFLKVHDDDPRQGELGYTLARCHWGNGFGSEAAQAVIKYCFVTLKLHRIIAVADSRNSASVALLERIGMRREGHFLQNVWFKGTWADEYLYAVLADEWRLQHAR
ncbi:MAG: GNAT family protein [Herpetosiphon sp.]